MKKGLTVERSLLALIAGLQVTQIAVDLRRDRAVRPGDEVTSEPVAASRAVEQPVYGGRPNGVAPTHGVQPSHRVEGRMVASVGSVNALMFQAVSDLERMSSLVIRDDDWRRLHSEPTMDMRERESDYLVAIGLPREVDPALLTVNLEGQLLSITGHSAPDNPFMRPVKVFERHVRLPGPIGNEQFAKATVSNGVLRVSLPKAPEVQQAAYTERARLF